MAKNKMIIYWSDEDQVFVAEVPDLPGCTAHGATQEAALASAQEAIRLWIRNRQRVWRCDSGAPKFRVDAR
jgi:predicted RNase H-like HicB family nuclease